MLNNKNMVKIFTLAPEHEILIPLIKKIFEENNIDMYFKSMHDAAYDGLFVGQKGAGAIYVFENDQEKAMEIIRDLIENQSE